MGASGARVLASEEAGHKKAKTTLQGSSSLETGHFYGIALHINAELYLTEIESSRKHSQN